jgi:dihydrofolate reductase
MRFNLIVAMCRDNGIGYKGQLPWKIPADLQYFSNLTKGDGNNAVIMGHKTWQSLPIPKGKSRGLHDRDNFVLSKTDTFDICVNHNHLLKTFKSIAELESYLTKNDIYEEVWVIGGAQIYKQCLEEGKISKCYITFIDEDFDCDTFFPELDPTEWQELERKESYDVTYECTLRYSVYEHRISKSTA